ncbi:hypothetical protein DITRI_Ditri07aG0067200 [Diplodiscus trichospermus]
MKQQLPYSLQRTLKRKPTLAANPLSEDLVTPHLHHSRMFWCRPGIGFLSDAVGFVDCVVARRNVPARA